MHVICHICGDTDDNGTMFKCKLCCDGYEQDICFTCFGLVRLVNTNPASFKLLQGRRSNWIRACRSAMCSAPKYT